MNRYRALLTSPTYTDPVMPLSVAKVLIASSPQLFLRVVEVNAKDVAEAAALVEDEERLPGETVASLSAVPADEV